MLYTFLKNIANNDAGSFTAVALSPKGGLEAACMHVVGPDLIVIGRLSVVQAEKAVAWDSECVVLGLRCDGQSP